MSDQAIGFACVGVAVVCFGSNFVPVKKFDTGDGVFYQWIMCCAVWTAGMIVNAARDFPPFEPFAMLGGVLWCTGNIMAVPVIQCIGLSLGMLLWGLSNLVIGWSSGAFGILGVTKETVKFPVLNYLGVVFCLASLVVYIFLKTETGNVDKKSVLPEEEGLVNNSQYDYSIREEKPIKRTSNNAAWVERLSKPQRRIVGIALALLSGLFYGVNFNPPTYLIETGHSKNGLDYVFSHFCGIWLTSTFYLLVYSAIKRNKPDLYPQAVLPGFLSGLLWAAADICWFVANVKLSIVVSFPIITTGPGVVASLWGIFVFREITGTRNFLILGLAFFISCVGVTLIALSKIL